jgi:sec-independent protein translocase protein TatA
LRAGNPPLITFAVQNNSIMNCSIILGFLGGLGGGEIFLIILVVLLIFGGKKIPELARGLGKGIREFKNASSGLDEEEKKKELNKPD